MKATRLELIHWIELLRLLVEYMSRQHAPEPLIRYLSDRFIGRASNDWKPHDDGWLDTAFDQWDRNASLYEESIAKDAQGAIAAQVALTTELLQIEHSDPASGINRVMDSFLTQFEQYGPWGRTCAKRDAWGMVTHAAVCLLNRLLAKRRDFAVQDLRELILTVAKMARFHTSNRLLAEQFPFTAALQQLKRQRTEVLTQLRADLEMLRTAVTELPFDSADLRRQRASQKKLIEDILQIAATQ
ncbi:MAG: hypothetical protein HY854_26430 [Burkholderiales bacterium]|nr:hypothetical protein [Burkholderiales bacterium]